MKAMVFSLAMLGGSGALFAAETTTVPAKDTPAEKCCMKMGMMTKEKGEMMCEAKSEPKVPAAETKAGAPTKPAATDHSAHH
jgi:hypothetical protein